MRRQVNHGSRFRMRLLIVDWFLRTSSLVEVAFCELLAEMILCSPVCMQKNENKRRRTANLFVDHNKMMKLGNNHAAPFRT